jgi:cardiolipin synthase
MSVPNIITIARILAVPLTVWLIIDGEHMLAFLAFIAAGISDGVDGFIARRYDLKSELGAMLDPLADKLLLVSIYVTLGFQQVLPAWLVILVVSRDVLIVGGVLLNMLMDRPMEMRPLLVSKVNTAGQIILAGAALAALGFEVNLSNASFAAGIGAVALLTAASGALYLRDWVRHMAGSNGESAKS